MRYRPGVEIALAKRWALDVFIVISMSLQKGKHIAGGRNRPFFLKMLDY